MHTGQTLQRPFHPCAFPIPRARAIEFPIGPAAGAGGLVQRRLFAMRDSADSRTESVRAHGG
jgi:hypothetical protein